MDLFSVTFAGHRRIDGFSEIEDRLYNLVAEIISDKKERRRKDYRIEEK